MAVLRDNSREIWSNYLAGLDWHDGKTKHGQTFYAFLRAVTLGIPEGEAKAEVKRLVESAGGAFSPRDHDRQWQRALDYANDGLSIPGIKSTPSVKVQKPRFEPEVLRAAAPTSGERDLRAILKDLSPTWAETPESFLRQIFRPGERVKLFLGKQETQGATWAHEIDQTGVDIGDTLDYPAGVWFLCNPVDGQLHENPNDPGKKSTRCEANITSFRWAVLESDTADPEAWLSMLCRLPLRIGAIYTSGKRSIHALIYIGESQDKAEWDNIIVPRKDRLVQLGADRGALSAVRLTRLPQAYRNGQLQELIYLNPECDIWPILGDPLEGDPWEHFDRWFEQVEKDRKLAKLDAGRFYLNNPPPAPRPIFFLAGKVILTPGNLCAIFAQAKAGKTALIGAALASTIGQGDTLGITSSNPDGLAVIHFDTEQSPGDHFMVGARALCRVDREQPEWLRSYSLVDADIPERLEFLEAELERARSVHRGIHSVILDGVADFCVNPNDLAEASELVRRLHRLAAKFETGIICVLHLNPKGEVNHTGRGHLGSELERKAETPLVLQKDKDGITTVFAEKARHCYIGPLDGPRFTWSEQAEMHVSVEAARVVRNADKVAELHEIAAEVFTNGTGLRFGELRDGIAKARGCTPRNAERLINQMRNESVVKRDFGLYRHTDN